MRSQFSCFDSTVMMCWQLSNYNFQLKLITIAAIVQISDSSSDFNIFVELQSHHRMIEI